MTIHRHTAHPARGFGRAQDNRSPSPSPFRALVQPLALLHCRGLGVVNCPYRAAFLHGFIILPKGTEATITRKYKGFNIETVACECCGLRAVMSYVPNFCLALLDQEQE